MKRLYLFIVSFIFFISGNTYADTTYIIKKGDNPYKIAKKFKVSIQDIIKVNNLKPVNLKPGTKITIPSNKKESPKKNKLARKQEEISKGGYRGVKGEKEGFSDDAQFYIVKKGDTLSSISRKYSISISELKEINNLRTTKLKPGQQLLVKRIGPRTYTVKKGDNIWRIAKRFDIDPDELRVINGLETDLLKPGQKILLEPEVEVDELKNYEAIISKPHIEEEIKGVSESEEFGPKEKLILFAKKLLNIPYRFGGSSLMGIDCSAYVQKVYSMIGIDLPRSAREQFNEGRPIDTGELSIGDLVFFKTYASFPSHVGIYLGNNLFIHASSRDKKVTIDSLQIPYYFKRFIGARRLIEGRDEKEELHKEG
ncbi:MAG: LysM peptidoglycan-binding domain-containing protein [Nitrospirota bacterium]